MARDIISRTLSGEVLPPQRYDIADDARENLPYANPNELLQRMGGFIQRWNVRGRAAASVEVSQQFERLFTSYLNLYQTTTRLTHARIEHGRALNELRHLDEILDEDNRRRREAYGMAAQRDELARLQLQELVDATKERMAKKGQAKPDVPEVPDSPSEQLRQAAAQRAELRKTIHELVAQVKREAGTNPLPPDLEEEIQRINSEAEKLILYSGSER